MILKLLTVDLIIPGCSSLKEKRYALSSLKKRLRNKFNVSVAEVDHHDKWQRCELAIVTASKDRRTADSQCDKVLRFVEGDHRVEIVDVQQEYR
ncbi:MAG: DUF503 domain-containing protein [Candidatus Latescibacterota bacterium]|jgi:uncharacterized protein YlxP (DUF503 family)